MKVGFIFFSSCLLLLFASCAVNGTEYIRAINSTTSLRYVRRGWYSGTYHEATEWCNSLGGQLPILHTESDRTYLAEIVIGPTRSDPDVTWLASSVAPGQGTCQWADGTDIESFHSFTVSCSLSNSHGPHAMAQCHSDSPCCALTMWTDVDFKKLTVRKCSGKAWMVCVIEELTPQEQMKGLNETIERLNKDVELIKSTVSQVEISLRSLAEDIIANQSSLSVVQKHEFENIIMDLKLFAELHLENLSDSQNKELSILKSNISDIMKAISTNQNILDLKSRNFINQISDIQTRLEHLETQEESKPTFNDLTDKSALKQEIETVQQSSQSTRTLIYVLITVLLIAAVIATMKKVDVSDVRGKVSNSLNFVSTLRHSRMSTASSKTESVQNLTSCV